MGKIEFYSVLENFITREMHREFCVNFFSLLHEISYLSNEETMADETGYQAMPSVLVRIAEALHVAHYCLATDESHLFCNRNIEREKFW